MTRRTFASFAFDKTFNVVNASQLMRFQRIFLPNAGRSAARLVKT
jgi:hypothetical protein